MINFIQILLQFDSFKIYFMKIQLRFIILRKISENSEHFSRLLKNIINVVKFYVTFVTLNFFKFPNISNNEDVYFMLWFWKTMFKIRCFNKVYVIVISKNISTDESVLCFDFTEESVIASCENNFWIREFKTFIYTLLIYRSLKIIIIT